MEWKRYFDLVVKRRQIVLEGWPQLNGSLINPYDLKGNELGILLDKWKDGVIHLHKISREELKQLAKERREKIAAGEIVLSPVKPRCDRGEVRIRTNPDTKGKKRRGAVKSKPEVESEDDRNIKEQGTTKHVEVPRIVRYVTHVCL